MTIAIDPVLELALQTAGTENNPVIAHVDLADGGTATTLLGTELSAASNALSGVTYNFWSATPSAGVARWKVVLSSSKAVDFVAIAAHNIGTIGADVKVQYSTDSGTTWTTTAAGTVSPTDDQAIAFRFESVTADYWRISVPNAGANDVVIGVVLISNELQLPQRIYQGYTPPITPTNVDLQSNVSEGGHLLGSSVVRKSSSAKASFTHIAPAFIRGATWVAFQTAFNGGNGFFWAWRPDKYGDVFYSWRAGPALVPTNSGPTERMAFEMQMRLFDEP